MPNFLILYDIPSYALDKWDSGMQGKGWKQLSRSCYAKALPTAEAAVTEVGAVFQALAIELEEDDEEHVRLVVPTRDAQGNPQIGVKTLFGKKPG